MATTTPADVVTKGATIRFRPAGATRRVTMDVDHVRTFDSGVVGVTGYRARKDERGAWGTYGTNPVTHLLTSGTVVEVLG